MADERDRGEADFEWIDPLPRHPQTTSAEDGSAFARQRVAAEGPPKGDPLAPEVRLGTFERALEILLVPPVAVWELGRLLLVRALPRLIRRLGAALAWSVRLPLTTARWLGAEAVDVVREVEHLVAPPLRAAVRFVLLGPLPRFLRSLASALRTLGRALRLLVLRVVVPIRIAARAVGVALRDAARVVAALARRAAVAARAVARPVAEALRLWGRVLRALAMRVLVVLREAARAVGLELRAFGRALAALGRRIAVVVRAGALTAFRTLAKPVRAAARMIRAAAHAVFTPLRWAWVRVLAAARATRRVLVWLADRLVLVPIRAARRLLHQLVMYCVVAPARAARALVVVSLHFVQRMLAPPIAAVLAGLRDLRTKLEAAARAAAAACRHVATRLIRPIALAFAYAGRAVRRAATRARDALLAARLRVSLATGRVRKQLRVLSHRLLQQLQVVFRRRGEAPRPGLAPTPTLSSSESATKASLPSRVSVPSEDLRPATQAEPLPELAVSSASVATMIWPSRASGETSGSTISSSATTGLSGVSSPDVDSAPHVDMVDRLRTFARTYPKSTAFLVGQVVFIAIAAGTQRWILAAIPIGVVLVLIKLTDLFD